MKDAECKCATCAHYGCCDDLNYCGGTRWRKAVDEDAESGSESEERDDGPDPYEQWLHNSEIWQESMDAKY